MDSGNNVSAIRSKLDFDTEKDDVAHSGVEVRTLDDGYRTRAGCSRGLEKRVYGNMAQYSRPESKNLISRFNDSVDKKMMPEARMGSMEHGKRYDDHEMNDYHCQ